MAFAVLHHCMATINILRLLCGIFLSLLLSRGAGRLASADTTPTLENVVSISDKCWIYMHLQKSGGTTVKGVLRHRFRNAYAIYDTNHWKKGDEYSEMFGKQLMEGKKNVMVGGYTEALRRSGAVDHKCKWFTVFRHPISRMVSAYYFCQKVPGDSLCGSRIVRANTVDLTTFAKHWGNFAMRQFALSLVPANDVMQYSLSDAARENRPSLGRFGGIPGWYLLKVYLDDQASTSEYVGIPEEAMYEMLQPVLDLLRDRYTVGILEEFNTTLSLFNAALDIPGIDWHEEYEREGNLNVDKRFIEEKASMMLEAWTNSEMKKYMQLDIVLYEHAVDVFRQQARAYGLE